MNTSGSLSPPRALEGLTAKHKAVFKSNGGLLKLTFVCVWGWVGVGGVGGGGVAGGHFQSSFFVFVLFLQLHACVNNHLLKNNARAGEMAQLVKYPPHSPS